MTHSDQSESILRSAGRFIGRNSLLPSLLRIVTRKHKTETTSRTASDETNQTVVSNALATLDLNADTTDWNAIESRYRQLAKQYHPDRFAAQDLPLEMLNAAESRFKDIQQAYQTLKLAKNL